MAVAASHAAAVQAKALATLQDISLVDEYTELLSAEVLMDVPKLRELARIHGVPVQYRGIVWSYLLGILPADRSHELSSARVRAHTYDSMVTSALSSHLASDMKKSVSAEFTRYVRRVPKIQPDRGIFERIITTFLNTHSQFNYAPAWVHVLAPFVACIGAEHEAYFCFESFMLKLVDRDKPLSQQMSDFLTMLRTLVPDVYNYLEEEQVDVRDWLPNWTQFMFAAELPFDSILRLWDAYLAEDRLDLHPFVCLAALHLLKEPMEDMEASEACAMLRKLPFSPTDVENLLHIASNLRLDVGQESACDEEYYPSEGKNHIKFGYVTSR